MTERPLKDVPEYEIWLKAQEDHCPLCGWNLSACRCQRHTHSEEEAD